MASKNKVCINKQVYDDIIVNFFVNQATTDPIYHNLSVLVTWKKSPETQKLIQIWKPTHSNRVTKMLWVYSCPSTPLISFRDYKLLPKQLPGGDLD